MAVAVSMLDRLALTACLIRFWGTAGFEHWSILLAATSLFALFDFGLQMHFGNRLTWETAAGEHQTARSLYRGSNTIFLGLALSGSLIATAVFSIPSLGELFGLRSALAANDRWIAAALMLAVAVKLAMTNLISVYRLNRAFGLGTVLVSLVDAARILSIAALAYLGFGPISAAIATATVTLLGFGLFVPMDISRRFAVFAVKFERPTLLTMKGAYSNGGLFFFQNLPNLIIAQLPVLLIGGTAAKTGVLASFLLIRTLLNFVRLLLFQVVQILGMECARLAAENRLRLMDRLYTHTNRCIAAVSGWLCGGMLSLGGPIFAFWTGQASLYRRDLMLVMIAPLLCVPSCLLANTYLAYSNRPFYPTLGRGLQLCIAVVLFFLVPFDDISLRLTSAICVGEVLGFAIPQIYASPRLMDRDRLVTEIWNIAVSFASFGVTYFLADFTKAWLPPDTMWRFLANALILGSGGALIISALLLRPSQLRLVRSGATSSDIRDAA